MLDNSPRDTCLAAFLETNYGSALREQEKIDIDPVMVRMLAGVDPYDDRQVQRFMVKYNLLRNCASEDIPRVLDAFHRFWKAWRQHEGGFGAPPRLGRTDVLARFEDLYARLYRAKQRNWISGTSKLLWCMYPSDIVIYDRFVHSALTTLQPLLPALRKVQRLGANRPPQEAGPAQVVAHYMRAWELVQALKRSYDPVLGPLWARHSRNSGYAWEIRVIDKLLVYLGNPDWEPGRKVPQAED